MAEKTSAHPELEKSGSSGIGNCDVAECYWQFLLYQTGKSVHVHAKDNA